MNKVILKLLIMSIFNVFAADTNSQTLKSGLNYFINGKFLEAQKDFSAVLEKKPDNYQALLYNGYICLLTNKLDESEKLLQKAKLIKPKFPVINNFLAQVYYRRKEFSKAASLFKIIGRAGMAKKLESFGNSEPYLIDTTFDKVSVKFLTLDPLPVVEVIINEEYKGNFFIDTGGGEIILEEEFVKKVKPELFAGEKSEFGGGKKAEMGHGRIKSITIGELTVRNVPVNTLNLRNLELGGYKVDGCIGTVFLYQFLSTIDYKNQQLVLRNKSKYKLTDIEKDMILPAIIPFSMADDHFMVVHGSVNNSDTLLLFVDTGLAGNAFTCPKSTLKKGNLNFNKKDKANALGGGGYFEVYPLEIEKLCLDNVCVEKLHGSYGPFPMQIEKCFGFNINGLISHEFFRTFSLTIDFTEMKYLISK